MAKVYTMGELERARKKAQIREWVQDKKDKATNWCYAHKNEILTYGPVVVSGIAAGAKMLSKHTAQAKEQDLKDLYVYSHRTGTISNCVENSKHPSGQNLIVESVPERTNMIFSLT